MEFEGRRRLKEGINLIPLINVVFLLQIFFLLAGTMQKTELFELELPRAETGDSGKLEPLYEPVEIVLGAHGELALNDKPIERAKLIETLEWQFLRDKHNPAVSFKADARAATGEMVDLIQDLRQSGARLLLLATQQPGSKKDGAAGNAPAAPTDAAAPTTADPATAP